MPHPLGGEEIGFVGLPGRRRPRALVLFMSEHVVNTAATVRLATEVRQFSRHVRSSINWTPVVRRQVQRPFPWELDEFSNEVIWATSARPRESPRDSTASTTGPARLPMHLPGHCAAGQPPPTLVAAGQSFAACPFLFHQTLGAYTCSPRFFFVFLSPVVRPYLPPLFVMAAFVATPGAAATATIPRCPPRLRVGRGVALGASAPPRLRRGAALTCPPARRRLATVVASADGTAAEAGGGGADDDAADASAHRLDSDGRIGDGEAGVGDADGVAVPKDADGVAGVTGGAAATGAPSGAASEVASGTAAVTSTHDAEDNWRRFRAALVCGGETAFEARCEEHPLGLWVHALASPEVGALLVTHPAVVTPDAPYMDQGVVFLTAHTPPDMDDDVGGGGGGPAEPAAGGGARRFLPPPMADLDAPGGEDSWGLLLNRPLAASLGDLAGHPLVRRALTAAGAGAPADVDALAGVPLYRGGGDSAPVVLAPPARPRGPSPTPPPPSAAPPPMAASGAGGFSPPPRVPTDAVTPPPPGPSRGGPSAAAASESWRPGVPPPSAAAAFFADGDMGGGTPGLPAPLVLSLLTHHPSIPHTHPIIPGVYAGAGRAVAAAAAAVRAGDVDPADLRLFLGAVRWRRQRLREAVEAGEVFVAAAAGGVVTKQCLGLPTPLWREVMEAMGEPFRRLSRQAYGEL